LQISAACSSAQFLPSAAILKFKLKCHRAGQAESRPGNSSLRVPSLANSARDFAYSFFVFLILSYLSGDRKAEPLAEQQLFPKYF